MHVGIKLLDRIPPWRVSPGHINYSPRLRLDEVISVGGAGSPSPLSSLTAGAVREGRDGSPSRPLFPLNNHQPTRSVAQIISEGNSDQRERFTAYC
jgi:hypothetical protein